MDDQLMKDRVMRAVTRIQQGSAAVVGLGIAQGRQAIQQHLDEDAKTFVPQAREVWPTAEQMVGAIQAYLDKLDAWLLPYYLPADYRYFISFYGGLHIHHQGVLYFSVYGFGVGAEYQYGLPMGGDDSQYENGLLVIGTLDLHVKQHAYYNRTIYFASDLAGHVRQGCVIAMPSGEWRHHSDIRDVGDVMRDLQKYSDCWTKLADSFTDWLELAAETQGALGYM